MQARRETRQQFRFFQYRQLYLVLFVLKGERFLLIIRIILIIIYEYNWRLQMKNQVSKVSAAIFCSPLLGQAHPGHEEFNNLSITAVFLLLMVTILMSTGFVYAYGRLVERGALDEADEN